MSRFELIDTVAVGNTLGECVLWNDRQQAIWWTDIHESRLYRFDLAGRALHRYELPERLASFGFTECDQTLVCAFASGFALYRLESGSVEWLARPEAQWPGNRFNDGRVDRQGRFWAGTMVEHASGPDQPSGSLYSLAGTQCRQVLAGISISNSLCWSPDSGKMFFADSKAHAIDVYKFNADTGQPTEPARFANTAPPFEPDGSTVDARGYVWNALWGGGKVMSYGSDGALAEELVLPVSQPTCVAFGGSDLTTLFVISARVGLSSEQLSREPQAGHLLIYATPYAGLPEPRFKL